MKFETVETTQRDIDEWRTDSFAAMSCPIERALKRKGRDVGWVLPEKLQVDGEVFRTSRRVHRHINEIDSLEETPKPGKFRIRVA